MPDDECIRWKVVLLHDPDRLMGMSALVRGTATRYYEIGVPVCAHPHWEELGYGLLVFDDPDLAVRWAREQFQRHCNVAVLTVRVRQPMSLPPILPVALAGNWREVTRLTKQGGPRYKYGDWPAGTEMWGEVTPIDVYWQNTGGK